MLVIVVHVPGQDLKPALLLPRIQTVGHRRKPLLTVTVRRHLYLLSRLVLLEECNVPSRFHKLRILNHPVRDTLGLVLLTLPFRLANLVDSGHKPLAPRLLGLRSMADHVKFHRVLLDVVSVRLDQLIRDIGMLKVVALEESDRSLPLTIIRPALVTHTALLALAVTGRHRPDPIGVPRVIHLPLADALQARLRQAASG